MLNLESSVRGPRGHTWWGEGGGGSEWRYRRQILDLWSEAKITRCDGGFGEGERELGVGVQDWCSVWYYRGRGEYREWQGWGRGVCCICRWVRLGVGHGMWNETPIHQVPSIRSKES